MSEAEIKSNIDALLNKEQLDVDTLSALALSQYDENLKLKAQLAWLQRKVFGSMSEKKPAYDPNQLSFLKDLFQDGAAEEAAKEAAEEAGEKATLLKVRERKQARHNRKMMEDLPVLEREFINPDGIDLSLYKQIGEEITRVVCFRPGMLFIKELVRPKYALRDPHAVPAENKPAVVIATMPLLPIYKGIADASLLAEVILKKYEYHMPFYRQAQELSHLGFKVSANTIDGWFKPTVNLLKGLYPVLCKELGKSHYHQADETTVPVMSKDKRGAPKEYVWAVRSPEDNIVVFFYRQGSRAGCNIEEFERSIGFTGYLQCDGFSGYESAFRASGLVTLVYCMAHARRNQKQFLIKSKQRHPSVNI